MRRWWFRLWTYFSESHRHCEGKPVASGRPMSDKPYWTLGTDSDGSFRVSDPSQVWIINFGDLGNLDLIEIKVLGRWFKNWAWEVAVPQLLEENLGLRQANLNKNFSHF